MSGLESISEELFSLLITVFGMAICIIILPEIDTGSKDLWDSPNRSLPGCYEFIA